MLPGKNITPEVVFTVLGRRRWLILLPLAIGLSVAPLIAERIPKAYKSETLIMVVPQRVPDSYVKSTVTGTVEDRLPSISDQILSRSRLERVITDFDLYKQLRATSPMEDVVARMRKDIGPVQIQQGQQSFRVSYLSSEPTVAQKVAARLASLFIDENSRDRESLAENTNVFLESQLEDAKRRLLDHEKKLEEYRRLHTGELPSQLESNLQAMQTTQLQLQSLSEAANRVRERRLLVERQLVDAQTTPPEAPLPASSPAEAQANLTPAQQLEIAQKSLEVLKLRYTADHPDVRRMERSIAELKVRADQETARGPEQTPAPKAPSAAEQLRQKRVRDLQADLEAIDRQLSSNHDDEIRLVALIDDYKRKIDAVPGRESDLVELTRDYETLKKGYDSLLTKREDSKLAANLERRQIGEQFRILDPASLPVRPANQLVRLGISFAGAAIGLALGLLIAIFLGYRDSSFAREEDVFRVLDLPVLAVVPSMPSDVERRQRLRRSIAVNAVAVTILAASASVLIRWALQRL